MSVTVTSEPWTFQLGSLRGSGATNPEAPLWFEQRGKTEPTSKTSFPIRWIKCQFWIGTGASSQLVQLATLHRFADLFSHRPESISTLVLRLFLNFLLIHFLFCFVFAPLRKTKLHGGTWKAHGPLLLTIHLKALSSLTILTQWLCFLNGEYSVLVGLGW